MGTHLIVTMTVGIPISTEFSTNAAMSTLSILDPQRQSLGDARLLTVSRLSA